MRLHIPSLGGNLHFVKPIEHPEIATNKAFFSFSYLLHVYMS